jgi:hypothetical protein
VKTYRVIQWAMGVVGAVLDLPTITGCMGTDQTLG